MNVPITPDMLNQLQFLQEGKKFTEEDFYPGAPTEEIRSRCESHVNDFLRDLIQLLQHGVDRGDIFARGKTLGQAFTHEDTEEREKVDDYIGEAMRIISLDDWTEHI